MVNKNARVLFCAVGADTALEHINRSMKVTGGLVGITLNQDARTKFFLIAPELAGKENLWSPMKKRKLLTWKNSGKILKVKAADKVVELQEDRSLFARMIVVCKSRPEVNIKEAVGHYEFSVVPRSLFAAGATMLHCSSKNTLMHILEKLNYLRQITNTDANCQNATPPVKVVIVDGMAEVQSLDKPDWIKNCA